MLDFMKQVSGLTVSSVLNRQVKEFGKKHLVDGLVETCWNSDQGSPQWINVQFDDPVKVNSLTIQFQGGFCGRSCHIECSNTKCAVGDDDGVVDIFKFYPEDINSRQTFPLNLEHKYTQYRIVFAESSDFYGRITVYWLDFHLA